MIDMVKNRLSRATVVNTTTTTTACKQQSCKGGTHEDRRNYKNMKRSGDSGPNTIRQTHDIPGL